MDCITFYYIECFNKNIFIHSLYENCGSTICKDPLYENCRMRIYTVLYWKFSI